jgi:hypothetical protein
MPLTCGFEEELPDEQPAMNDTPIASSASLATLAAPNACETEFISGRHIQVGIFIASFSSKHGYE